MNWIYFLVRDRVLNTGGKNNMDVLKFIHKELSKLDGVGKL